MTSHSVQTAFEGFEPYKLNGVTVTNEELGTGSYATVLKLDYMGLKCAGKNIHELLLGQGATSYIVQRFRDECHILSRIRHPNIVQFLGVHFQKGVHIPIIVMEFLPLNITQCLDKYTLQKETIFSILHDVALGLHYLHGQPSPIVHRDLSSNNVLLTSSMTAKISDLGVARILNLPPHVTHLTETPGTPAFMPPEVMVAKPKYDTSVDIFSYGILMVHMLSGKWPAPQVGPNRFEGNELIPVSEAERREEFIQMIGNDHPLMDLILKCIHNSPRMRGHAGEIVKRLADLVVQSPISFSNQLEMMEYISRLEKANAALEEESLNLKDTHMVQMSQQKMEIISKLKRKQEEQQRGMKTLIDSMEVAVDNLKASLTTAKSQYIQIECDFEEQEDEQEGTVKKLQQLDRISDTQPPPTGRSKQRPPVPKKPHGLRQRSPEVHSNASNKRTESESEEDNESKGFTVSLATETGGKSSVERRRTSSDAAVSKDGATKGSHEKQKKSLKKTMKGLFSSKPKEDKTKSTSKNSTETSGTSEDPTVPSTKGCGAMKDSTPDDLLYPIYTAMFDYEASSPSELSFKKGEQMYIKNKRDGKMWYASITVGTSREGNVPKNFVSALDNEEWYFGKLDTTLAKNLVMTSSNQLGSFLIRQNKDSGEFSLTIRDQNKAKHYHIYKQDDGMLYVSKQCPFKSLSDLVLYHSQHAKGLCTTLARPCIAPHCISDKQEVNLTRKQASGQFSEVWQGGWQRKVVTVNKIKPNAVTQLDLLDQGAFMKTINCQNIIQFHAVYLENEPFLVITECTDSGSLKQYLPSEGSALKMAELLKLSAQVADAMSYLEKRSCIHQDLSAKNVMVEVKDDEEDTVINCKLDIYPYVHRVSEPDRVYKLPAGIIIPIKWSPHEAIVSNQISIKSNVWSFGITLWEIIHYCNILPYPDMTDAEVIEELKRGNHMLRPPGCPEELYELMNNCWDEDATSRPTFETLHAQLEEFSTSDQFGYAEVSFSRQT